MKGLIMLNKKSKEQLISLLLLGSVFIFFVYLKMNPESHSEYVELNSLDTKTKVHEMVKQDVIEIDSYTIETSILDEIDQIDTAEPIRAYYRNVEEFLNDENRVCNELSKLYNCKVQYGIMYSDGMLLRKKKTR